MRILIITHYFAEHRGGIEIVANEIAKRLADREIAVTWAASGPVEAVGHPNLRYLPMKAWNFTERLVDVPYPFWSIGSLMRMLAELKQSDVVHLHNSIYMGQIVAYVFARLWRIPVVITQHIDIVPYPNPALRFLHWLSNRLIAHPLMAGARSVTFVSEKVERYFERFVNLRGRSQVIANGVDSRFHPLSDDKRAEMRRMLHLPEGKKTLLFVGRFTGKKGLSLLREVAPRMAECQWIFIGWGKNDPRAWGLPNVTCLGTLTHEELVPYCQAADLFVLPSVGEGFPLVVQEAMACGTPVVISKETASAFTGIEKAVHTANTVVDDIERAIREGLDPQGYEERRQKTVAYVQAQSWNWDECADRYAELMTSKREAPIRSLLPQTSAG